MNTIVYTDVIDRSNWPEAGRALAAGEPDKVQWTDELSGLPCMIRRHPRHGIWCGYVGVDETHPLYKQSYEWGYDHADVRVDVNFASLCHDNGNPESDICHVPAPGESDAVWWFGFDCGHAGMLSPAYEAIGDWEVYVAMDAVKNDVSHLAGILKAMA
jgi:hypothetical protein